MQVPVDSLSRVVRNAAGRGVSPAGCAMVNSFSAYVNKESKCLVCREPIMSKLRRSCRGGDYSTLVDQDLWRHIQRDFRAELESGASPPGSPLHAPVLAPEPGELKREAEKIMQAHMAARQKEAEASRIAAEKLQREEEAEARSRIELKARDEEAQSQPLIDSLVHEQELAPVAAAAAAATAAAVAGRGQWSCTQCTVFNDAKWLRCQVCSAPKDVVGATAAKSAPAAVIDAAPAVAVAAASNQWACRQCTYLTDAKWLRCALCGAPKSV